MKLVGIDTGGTFTDFVLRDEQGVRTLKLPSTPAAPDEAIRRGLDELGIAPGSAVLVHGFTVATNALLTRSGGPAALVTTAGFEDLLELARQARAGLYELAPQEEPGLVARERVHGLRERLAEDGGVLQAPASGELESVAAAVAAGGARSAAVVLLHSYANPAHEQAIARRLEARGLTVKASHAVLPEYREYERAATTVVSAYLAPVVEDYLGALERGVGQLLVMLSHGGLASSSQARERPEDTLLSGPAAGVLAAHEVARRAGFPDALSIDMGGTSTDVALIPGRIQTSVEARRAGLPLRTPSVDIETVGAGGGSIAWLDPGGALRVGPASAGAEPGPACYGRGGAAPTLTDANLVLGRLGPAPLLAGRLRLDAGAARRALEALARQTGTGSVHELALGMVAIALTHTVEALRLVSAERGVDPAGFSLVAFGGAGPLHAAEMAEALGLVRVIVPPEPGNLSALGMTLADYRRHYARTELTSLPADDERLERLFAELERQARADLAAEGVAPQDMTLERACDARYRGQAYEITLPYGSGASLGAAFHAAHAKLYGLSDESRTVELVTLRLLAVGRRARPAWPRHGGRDGCRPARGSAVTHKLWTRTGERDALVLERGALGPGERLLGPAVVVESGATTYLPEAWALRVDHLGNLILRREADHA